MHPRSVLTVAFAAAVALGTLASCSSDPEEQDAVARAGLVEAHRVPAARATALAVEPDGDLLVGELESGRLLAVDPRDGTVSERGRVAGLDTRPTQRGLLGLAVTDRDGGEVLAALTGSDGRIVVARVADDGATTTVWRGPRSADEANGGRLVVLPDGAIAIGIGDLLDPDRSPDPLTPNGKVLRIGDGDGFTALAGGLNNPFAFAPGPEGTLWVADNAPGQRPERLLEYPADGAGEADAVADGRVVASWTDTRVPSGLAWLGDGRLALCWYATSELRVVEADQVAELDDPDTGTLVADDCRYGVVALPGGGLAYAAESDVVVLRPT